MTDDRLSEMFKMQVSFMERLREFQPGFPQKWPLDMSQKTSQLEIKDLAFNCVAELFEVIQELKNSKKHRKTENGEFDLEHFGEECVDAFKFFLEILIFVGITPEMFYEMYCKKDAVINKRIDDGV